MSSRYSKVFESLRARNHCAFIPFAVAGDPDESLSFEIFKTYIDAGADVLEIGYPFSDPIADGPINQRAGIRALGTGLNHARFFALVKKIRSYAPDIPIGILLYANTVFHYGYQRFCDQAARAGIDSLLVADMPPEESGELQTAMKNAGLETVYIVSELTPDERIGAICRAISGFVYVVSRLGPTGTQTTLDTTVSATLRRLRQHTQLPLCVGFGISQPQHISEVKAAGADGAIVGSALVDIIERNLDNPKVLLTKLAKQVRAFKAATR